MSSQSLVGSWKPATELFWSCLGIKPKTSSLQSKCDTVDKHLPQMLTQEKGNTVGTSPKKLLPTFTYPLGTLHMLEWEETIPQAPVHLIDSLKYLET